MVNVNRFTDSEEQRNPTINEHGRELHSYVHKVDAKSKQRATAFIAFILYTVYVQTHEARAIDTTQCSLHNARWTQLKAGEKTTS